MSNWSDTPNGFTCLNGIFFRRFQVNNGHRFHSAVHIITDAGQWGKWALISLRSICNGHPKKYLRVRFFPTDNFKLDHYLITVYFVDTIDEDIRTQLSVFFKFASCIEKCQWWKIILIFTPKSPKSNIYSVLVSKRFQYFNLRPQNGYWNVKHVTCREKLLRNRNDILWNHRHRHHCRTIRRNNRWSNVYGDHRSKDLEQTPYFLVKSRWTFENRNSHLK